MAAKTVFLLTFELCQRGAMKHDTCLDYLTHGQEVQLIFFKWFCKQVVDS